MEDGLVAHTLNEERDLNSAKPLFENVQATKIDPEMVKLAIQLVDRQSGQYDPADLEDRYETRLRAMLDAKLKGEGFSDEPEPELDRSNVIDLMAALQKSLGDAAQREPVKASGAKEEKPRVASAAKRAKAPTPDEMRRQPAFKLPIEGGQKGKAPRATAEATPSPAPERTKRSRRRA